MNRTGWGDKMVKLQSATKKRRQDWTDYLYLVPAVLLIGMFFISSIVYTFRLSFFSWDGFGEQTFVGLENYRAIFQDSNLRISMMNTLIWVVCSLIINLIIPLILAILIVNSTAQSLFKNFFYFPSTLSGIVASVIMGAMLSTYGIPQFFGLLGLKSWVRDWLAIPYLNTFIMILMGCWSGIGMSMLLFIAGLRGLDRSCVESAQIDGAHGWKLYRHIVLPMLSATTKVVLLMTMVNSFKVFDNIWVMTKGGPYRTSETFALSMYVESFVRSNFGGGAAVAVVLSLIVMVVSIINLWNNFRSER